MSSQENPSLRTATKSDGTMNFVQAPRNYVTSKDVRCGAGKICDLVAIAVDPLADISELERVRSVMKDGQVVKNELASH